VLRKGLEVVLKYLPSMKKEVFSGLVNKLDPRIDGFNIINNLSLPILMDASQ